MYHKALVFILKAIDRNCIIFVLCFGCFPKNELLKQPVIESETILNTIEIIQTSEEYIVLLKFTHCIDIFL